MEFLCSICSRNISRGWYCYGCYKTYRSEIESNQPWTRFVQNEEKTRRRRPQLFFLGDCDVSNDGVIIIIGDGYGR